MHKIVQLNIVYFFLENVRIFLIWKWHCFRYRFSWLLPEPWWQHVHIFKLWYLWFVICFQIKFFRTFEIHCYRVSWTPNLNTFTWRKTRSNDKWNGKYMNGFSIAILYTKWATQGKIQTNKRTSSDVLLMEYMQSQGHLVNSNTLRTISSPVGICDAKSSTLATFSAIWRFLAVSFPFCIGGTRAAAAAHSTVMAVQQKSNHKLNINSQTQHSTLKMDKHFAWMIQNSTQQSPYTI